MGKGPGVRDMACIAMCAALMSVCAWVAVPTAPPFTLQTLAVFLTLALLGGRRGTLAVAVYIGLGALGAPVFAGFQGGIGALVGATGGYIVGFLAMGGVYWLATARAGVPLWAEALALAAGLAACYAIGTAWYMLVYARGAGAIGIGAALGRCVVPFILPDAAKLAAALLIVRRLRRVPGAAR